MDQSENNDPVIDRLMEDYTMSWISENLVDLHLQEQFHQKLKSSSLSICIREEDDFPHPRHLCIKYPFAKTPSKKHCKKCYCYVCQEIAPCNKWNKPTKKHCHATEDDFWKSEKKAIRNKVSGFNTTMAHHTLSVSFMHHPPNQTVLISGFAGGMISDINGNWKTGFSMQITNNQGRIDSSVPPYIAVIEGLKLAWSRGFRYLDLELGYLYHDGFWEDFKKDAATGKYHLRQGEASLNNRPRVWSILREVESCINRDWFINVKNSKSIKEESGALALAMMTSGQPMKKVYDFPSHPLTSKIKQIAETCKESMGPLFETNSMSRVPGDPFKDLKMYSRSS